MNPDEVMEFLKSIAHTLAAATKQIELLRSDLHAARNEIQELNDRLDANDRIELEIS